MFHESFNFLNGFKFSGVLKSYIWKKFEAKLLKTDSAFAGKMEVKSWDAGEDFVEDYDSSVDTEDFSSE